MVEVIKAFCWHQKFVPKGFSALAPGLYTCIKSLKMCIKSDFEEIILKLATYGQSDKEFLLTSKFCPQGVVCPCPGAVCMYKSFKMCLKSYFKEIVLKLATDGQSDKGFLLTSTFVPKGLIAPALYKSIKIYTRTRCQVSVYRITGPLVYFYIFLKRQCLGVRYRIPRLVAGVKLGGDLGKIVTLGAEVSPKLGSGRSGSLPPPPKKKIFLEFSSNHSTNKLSWQFSAIAAY